MQPASVLFDITKVADSRWKNADASRNQGVCDMNYIFVGSTLGITVISFIVGGYVWQILGWGSFSPSPASRHEKAHPG